MKKLLLSLFITLVYVSGFSQVGSTYQAAKELDFIFNSSALKNNENPQCINLKSVEDILWHLNIKQFSKDNPFFDDFKEGFDEFLNMFNICEPEEEPDKFSPNIDVPLFANSNDATNNMSWQSALLLGTADFMAQRFKDELVNYAIKQLITNLDDTKLESVKLLFPKTGNYIDNFLKPNQDKGFYYSDLEMLKYHSELDLKDLSYNLPEFITAIDAEKANLLKFSTTVLTNSSKFSNPLDIFNELKKLNIYYNPNNISAKPHIIENEYTNLNNIDIEKQLYLLNIFVNALRNELESSSDIWIEYSKVNSNYIESNLKIKFFYALLYEQTNNLNGFDAPLSKEELIRLTKKASSGFEKIEKAYNIADNKESTPDQAEYINMLNAVFESIDSFNTQDAPQLKELLDLTLEIQDVVSSNKKQYIIPNILLIVNELGINYNLFNREVLNTLVLLIDFTSVESAEGMKNLLSTYALPIGSSSLKRTGKLDISLNGYVGFTAGYETLGSEFDNTFYNLGLTAPIGIAISHRYSERRKFISSGSIFLGFLDLASLVNNSFDDTVEVESNLSLKQFFVPSLGYYFNVNNSPFSFGLVGSYHMASRALNDAVTINEELDSFRFNFSVLVDIPFFTLKHKN
jgi:hypothetical protein